MKYISPSLLVAQAIYLAFVPTTIAHSIIVFALAGLFAFNQYLLSQETPSLSIELEKLKKELEQQIEKQKETYDSKIKAVEDELSKAALGSLKSSSTSSSPAKKYVF